MVLFCIIYLYKLSDIISLMYPDTNKGLRATRMLLKWSFIGLPSDLVLYLS